jgi:glycosyltransferase involved in cell wall biosynthesis
MAIIAVDIRPLIGENTSGVETYILELLNNILVKDKKNTYILYINAYKNCDNILKQFNDKNVEILHTRNPNKIFNLLLSFLRWPKLDLVIEKKLNKKPDIFFVPDLRPSPISKKTQKITVIHDLAYHHFPKFFSLKTRLWYKIINPQKEIKESSKIIAVSHFTKKDLINTYKIDPSKILVIHEGVNKIIDNKQKNLQNLPLEYFLFLSTLEPRKNLNMLIKAFSQFKKQNKNDIKLVIAGKENKKIFNHARSVAECADKDIILTGFVNEKEKASLFTHAKAFIYPSIFEGFGIPLLEAMKHKTPIITSLTSSMPEVAGDAAIFIDPYDQNSLAKAMEEILVLETRKMLKAKMEQQIKKFSWEKCARGTMELFISLY